MDFVAQFKPTQTISVNPPGGTHTGGHHGGHHHQPHFPAPTAPVVSAALQSLCLCLAVCGCLVGVVWAIISGGGGGYDYLRGG